MDFINVTCAEIQTPVGFLYVILPVILNHTTLSGDCEQSWYLEDGRLIADPSDPQTLNDTVISVSSDRLVTSRCVNLIHQIICDSPDGLHFSRVTAFRARNQTAATPNPDDLNEVTPDLQLPDQWWWISALIVILLLVLICFLLRKKILRYFQREEWFICRREAPDNRDLVKVGSDHPNTLQESVQ